MKTWFLVKLGFSVQDRGLVGMVRVRCCFMFIKVLIKIEVQECVWGGARAFHANMLLIRRDHCTDNVDNIVALILSGPLIVSIYS